MTLSERAITEALEKSVDKALDSAILEIGRSLDQKNIGVTGKLKKSQRKEIVKFRDVIRGILWIKAYGVYHDRGVAPKDIPYTVGGPKRGGKSKYIEGLVTFWKFKGLSDKEALGAAFGTAHNHKKYGFPRRFYERHGRGSHFITDRVAKIAKKAGKIVAKDTANAVRLAVRSFIQKEINTIDPVEFNM